MATTIDIDPVTRIEGHLAIKLVVDVVHGEQQVVDVEASGTLFRGFERILEGRDPLDAPDLCQRICGICSVSHGLASVLTLENAAHAAIPDNARLLRNLVLAADTLQSHLAHFYVLSLPDFAPIQPIPPWSPDWSTDRRIGGTDASRLSDHHVRALTIRRKLHEMAALFAGRMPHSPALVPGGFTGTPRQSRIDGFRASIPEVLGFIQNEYQQDVQLVANAYPDYYTRGAGPRHLMCFGGFPLDGAGTQALFRAGFVQNAAHAAAALDVNAIREEALHSWYQANTSVTALRVNCGGGTYTDALGQVWSADYGCTQGSARSTTAAIQGTNDPKLYQTWRLGPRLGSMTYTFTGIPNGNATVTLKFDETYWTSSGNRLFDVAINGKTVLTGFDIYAAGGAPNRAVDRQFSVQVTAGQVAVKLTATVDCAKVCAIEIASTVETGLHPSQGTTVPVHPKADAYSWLKAPRYSGLPVETGPLARMWVNGLYQNGVSVMDRHAARAAEALSLAERLDGWAQELLPAAPVYQQYDRPGDASGWGLVDAPRGALGHWITIASSKIARYQVVTPTCWNASPRDGAGTPGPLEQALLATPIQNLQEPVEAARIVRSFDPCLACAVHVGRPAADAAVVRLS